MSSDEEPSVPVLPKDSSYRSNSVSSELQEEYEDLLQNAVVSPRFEALASARLQGRSISHLSLEGRNSLRNSQQVADHANVRSSPLAIEHSSHFRAPHERLGYDSGRGMGSSDGLYDALQPNTDCTEMDLFISDENIIKIENILDTWTSKLKTNVLRELRKWRVAFIEQHRQELEKERDIHTAQKNALTGELKSLKDLLNTYEISNKRKDEVIRNLSLVLDRQKNKLDKLKVFTHWRLQYLEAKEEAHATQMARQHYRYHLKRKVWLAWNGEAKKEWKSRMEQACRARAQEVCARLAEEYEAKLEALALEHNQDRERAQAEIQRMQLDRERREVTMRKALMRGVCALNMETLQLFNVTDGGSEEPDEYDHESPPDDDPDHDHDPDPDPDSESSSGTSGQVQPRPGHSPDQFDHPKSPTVHEDKDRMGFGASVPGAELPLSTSSASHTAPHTSAPHTSAPHTSAPHIAAVHTAAAHTAAAYNLFSQGGTAAFHKASGGVITPVQQKTPKVLTARITAQHAAAKGIRSTMEAMGVAPPMSSIVVDHHHSITQQTIGQATAAKFPRSSQQATRGTGGKTSTRAHPGTYPQPHWDDPGCASLAQGQPSTSPVHFDRPESPTHHEEDDMMGVWCTSDVLPSTSAAHSSGTSHKQAGGRIVTASQQKAAKTITARITAQHVPSKSTRGNLQVMGVAPSMSSIVVERHQPITQLIGGQSAASKFPRSSQHGPRAPAVRTSSRAHTSSCNVHSIKVVE
uniref:centrosomal protein POC5 n=1 Tax=Doryrhamphus excisus TaxID=161450 RepID=UPI0025AE6D43|nr:centrosomal protein POC5 [Doryrhamphus excisus]XP_057926044.1 centrosomal protein POC5 [Doryrhamphus excisus]XP_057926045.1 centrosomal protein POC5 [Doryrhamphus excisus]XP_057926046.1 centrosomal protein POC5 [Doryrhamphus excisus]XP_057926047.1 centrosomal protein POC5 [Doryrhamphus excisus]